VQRAKAKPRLKSFRCGDAHQLLGDAFGGAKNYPSAESHHIQALKLFKQIWKGEDPKGMIVTLERKMQHLLLQRSGAGHQK
jgi:hypothetical protein